MVVQLAQYLIAGGQFCVFSVGICCG